MYQERALRRSWHRRKSHLPKHASLPELQLLPENRPIFRCRNCGFVNTLLPLCLWCTWSSREAEHEFRLSTPRSRRVSAPCRVLFSINVCPESPLLKAPCVSSTLVPFSMPRHRNGGLCDDQTAEDYADVSTATPPMHPLELPSEARPSVDRSITGSRTMTATISPKTLKASRRALAIDCDTLDAAPASLPASPTKPDSPRGLRTLRRMNHLNLFQRSLHTPEVEPISISLTLRQQPQPSSKPPAPFPRNESMSSSSSNPVRSQTSPTRLPPSTSPYGLHTAPDAVSMPASPVKIGHPSRPYYSVIRKKGISPPSSRPASPAPSRPSSYTPPSANPTTSVNASRHLSLSSLFAPPCPNSPFSAFALDDDDDDTTAPPRLPPTPKTSFSRFSLPTNVKHAATATPSNPKSLHSVGFSMSGQTELRMTLAKLTNGSGTEPSAEEGEDVLDHFGSITSDAGGDAAAPAGRFKFRETSPQDTVESILGRQRSYSHGSAAVPQSSRSHHTLMGRVRKLRKGLKGMLSSPSS